MPNIVTLSKRPDLEPKLWSKELSSAWPEFMLNDPLANLYFDSARFGRYHEYMLAAYDEAEPDRVVARAFSVPFRLSEDLGRSELPDGGWGSVVRWADQDYLLGRQPNAVSALEITVAPHAQGHGLSGRMLAAVRANSQRLGFEDLYAPVRPSHKHLEPDLATEAYLRRTRPDGLPADPWLRVHRRAGGRVVKIAPHSMVVAGTLNAWRSWTGLPFDTSGPQTVPHALAPVFVSVEQNHAVYTEPNIWVHHRTQAS